jgi:hypothetical protein
MSFTQRFSEACEVLDWIVPAVYGAGEQNTAYNSFRDFHRGAVIIMTGTMSAAMDVDFEQATTTAGAGAKSFNAGGKDLNLTTPGHVYIFEIKSEEFDTANEFDCLNVELTLTDNVAFSLLMLGVIPRYKPATVTAITVTD